MRVRQTCLGLFLMGCALTALSADDKKPLTDETFVTKAAADGMHEVELGKIAQMNAQSPAVKSFGKQMVDDHSKANEELKMIAGKAGIMVPSKAGDDKMKELDKFKDLKGADFDKAYMSHMVKDHEKAVAMFSKAAKDLKDPGLKGFAEKTLPTIQMHLKNAKAINDAFGKQ